MKIRCLMVLPALLLPARLLSQGEYISRPAVEPDSGIRGAGTEPAEMCCCSAPGEQPATRATASGCLSGRRVLRLLVQCLSDLPPCLCPQPVTPNKPSAVRRNA